MHRADRIGIARGGNIHAGAAYIGQAATQLDNRRLDDRKAAPGLCGGITRGGTAIGFYRSGARYEDMLANANRARKADAGLIGGIRAAGTSPHQRTSPSAA